MTGLAAHMKLACPVLNSHDKHRPREVPLKPSTPKNPAALVLGIDSHGLAVARALAQSGVVTYGAEKDRQQPGRHSRYLRHCFDLTSYEASDLARELPRIRAELATHDAVVLLANNDRQVEAVASLLPALSPHFHIAWAEQAATIVMLQKKDQLAARCQQQGLNYPRSQVFAHADSAYLADGFNYPMIVKPVRPLSSFKTLLVDDPEQLSNLLHRYAGDLPILGQEFIAGSDLSLYFGALTLDRGRVVQALIGQKLASHPPAQGQTVIALTVDAPAVLAATEQFFAGLCLSGPVSLELKQSADGTLWVIEPTLGRTDFWAGLCTGAGFNQPLQEYQLALGITPTAHDATRACLWYDSERAPLAYPSLVWRQRSLRPYAAHQVFCYFGHGDRRPFYRACLQLLARFARQIRQNLQPSSGQ